MKIMHISSMVTRDKEQASNMVSKLFHQKEVMLPIAPFLEKGTGVDAGEVNMLQSNNLTGQAHHVEPFCRENNTKSHPSMVARSNGEAELQQWYTAIKQVCTNTNPMWHSHINTLLVLIQSALFRST